MNTGIPTDYVCIGGFSLSLKIAIASLKRALKLYGKNIR
ncbi:hypothetical protein LBBP_03600 [Leptospira borgpetersenii serovar Ballum]|uniref:Uncharacterized protein n=1 Tax=Leptospira borgpetersenii serovar Ballum TaxID=280505 RepID=A0A0S2IVW8_LEPBO|nr:hypothetical protein LBBP_03600 [Leptospira borgpetersenii serovar Ballum]